MNLFKFDDLITPKILTGIYLLTTLLAALACILTFIGGSVGGAVAWGLVALFNRIFFECIIVVFKNNEYLRRIADAMDGGVASINQDKDKRSQWEKDFAAEAWKSKQQENHHNKASDDADFGTTDNKPEKPDASQDKQ